MIHMKRSRENTLCMLYLPRVKAWTTSIREVTCEACKKQVPQFIEEQIESLETKATGLKRDLAWFELWLGGV